MRAKFSNNVNADRNALHNVLPLDTPYSMFIDVCNVCNFKCKFCAVQCPDRELSFKRMCMSYIDFKKIIDDLKGFSRPLKMLRLYCNGEPLINRDLPEMIQYAKNAGVTGWLEIVTNASLLSPDLNKKLLGAGLDRIRISIEGVDEVAYQEISQSKIDWKRFVDNIRDLYDNKEQCEIYIKTVDVAVENEEQKEKFFATFGDICDKIFIEHIAPVWAGYNKINEDFSLSHMGLNGVQVREVGICPFPFYACVVNPDGTVTACCSDWERKIILGNALTQNICDIWHGNKLRQFLKGMVQGGRNSYPTICAKCEYPCYNASDDLDQYKDVLLEKFGI